MKNKHHYIPKSRRKGMGKYGVCQCDEKIHALSHLLFGNMLPEEIVEWLNTTLWDNAYEIMIRRRGED